VIPDGPKMGALSGNVFEFTSTYVVHATPDQVFVSSFLPLHLSPLVRERLTTDHSSSSGRLLVCSVEPKETPTGGQKGSYSIFQYGIYAPKEIICWASALPFPSPLGLDS
jgi:hypothetical protein